MGIVQKNKNIWIDVDNSPHVPFFVPIIKELNCLGYGVFITARECSQTCGLADLYHLPYKRIGRHYGRYKILKVLGTLYRGWQLAQAAKKEKPILALSHGSRAQIASAWILRIPSLVIADYEHASSFLRPTWIMMPEVISDGCVKTNKKGRLRYPGIKEDVYVPFFTPNPAIKGELGIKEEDLVVTIRPPATEAHYHNPESEILFSKTVNLLKEISNVRMVILPRTETQEASIENEWAEWLEKGKIIIPEHIVDGLNLLWHSDLAISGGGTMNREAAALGVPVYSIFRGKTGDVDRYLARTGRLTLIESVRDIKTKIIIAKRDTVIKKESGGQNSTLKAIVGQIIRVLENGA